MNPLDEYIPMVEEMKQMMQGNTEVVSEFVESDTFEKLMESLDKQDRAGERIKYIPMSVIEDIKAEIELQKKGFTPSSDYYKAITRTVNIID